MVRNTRQFVEGRAANNVLLTGSRGTGKSSVIKALLNAFHSQGLRMIEVDKAALERGSRSGRVAWQFAKDWIGQHGHRRRSRRSD
ncbi:MAG: DUF815 domain-containing protein [Betaproteobacteria bacterium]|nr:DUF815 domain-containing protein [Betaproteobacteria bacterium]